MSSRSLWWLYAIQNPVIYNLYVRQIPPTWDNNGISIPISVSSRKNRAPHCILHKYFPNKQRQDILLPDVIVGHNCAILPITNAKYKCTSFKAFLAELHANIYFSFDTEIYPSTLCHNQYGTINETCQPLNSHFSGATAVIFSRFKTLIFQYHIHRSLEADQLP